MKRNSHLFITFEGCEGCGKSTQARLLYKRLQRLHITAVLTREPGGTPLGKRIRNILKVNREFAISPEAELLLFAACRAQLVRDIIRPALKEGKVVICDRFADSTTVYQGYGRGLELKIIEQLNRVATERLKPDITVLIDIKPELSLQRKLNPEDDRFEREDLAFHRRIREGYLELAGRERERWFVIDGNRSIGEIQRAIWNKINSALVRRQFISAGG